MTAGAEGGGGAGAATREGKTIPAPAVKWLEMYASSGVWREALIDSKAVSDARVDATRRLKEGGGSWRASVQVRGRRFRDGYRFE